MHRTIRPNGLPDDVARMLFEAWMIRLSSEKFGFTQHGAGGNRASRSITLGSPAECHFVIEVSGREVSLSRFSGLSEADVEVLADRALREVAANNFGGTLVYVVNMTVEAPNVAASPMHFMRLLGDQVHIEGPRRLSDLVLLDFEEGLLEGSPEGGLLFAPASKLKVTIFVPGPCSSDLSKLTAAGVSELVAAVCALATGRSVLHDPPIFPAEEPESAAALVRRADLTIPGLARDSVSLDVFGELSALGGPDAVFRIRGSLLAYHAALRQSSPDVAVMLFVTCVEALISPRETWGKLKVTQRFIKSLLDLCPGAVDELLRHDNVEEAFGYTRRGGLRRQRRDLLSRIYEIRSLPTHAGLVLSPAGLTSLAAPEGMRVALLSDLARAAILNYLQAPRCSLVGHPLIDHPDLA